MKPAFLQKLIISFFAVVTLIAIIISCKKLDTRISPHESIDYTPKFFNVPANTDNAVKAIAEKLKRLNDSAAFVNSFSKRKGFPVWNKALVASYNPAAQARGSETNEEDSTIVYIPLDKDSLIDATLMIKMTNSDTAFKLLNNYDYKRFSFDTSNTASWNARDVMNIFTHFENTVFGRTSFVIRDHRLVPSADSTRPVVGKMKPVNNQSGQRTSFIAFVEYCTEWEFCYGDPEDFEEMCTNECNSSCQFYIEDDDDCTYVWYTIGESSGGGGGGSENAPVLFWQTDDGAQLATDAGWEPWDYQTDFLQGYEQKGYHHLETWTVSVMDLVRTETFRNSNIDTTGLDSCVRKVLNKLLSGNNAMGKLLGKLDKAIFKTSSVDKFQLKFIASQSLGFDTYGKTGRGDWDNSSKIFYDTIYLNQRIIDSATEMGIARTILHEVVHAYLSSILNRWAYTDFNPTQISNMSYDTLFNKFIDSMMAINKRKGIDDWVQNYPERDHSYMADHFIGAFEEALKAVDNGRNSDEYYWLLSWGDYGIHER